MFALLLVTDNSKEACLATRHLAQILEFRRFSRIKVLLPSEQYELECFDRLVPVLMKSGTVIEGAGIPRDSSESILDEAA